MKTLEDLIERLEMIKNDEYSSTQLKNWLCVNQASSDGNIIDFAIDELESGTSTVIDIADSLSNYLENSECQ